MYQLQILLNFKSTLASKIQSFMPSIRFIPILSLLVIVSFTTLSYADYPSPLKQIQAGVAPEDIQCNADFVHVVYSEKHACVKESTAEKKGWEIIAASTVKSIESLFDLSGFKSENIDLVNDIPEATYVSENTLFIDNSVSASASFSEPADPCIPRTTIELPETFKIGVPFDIKYRWTWISYNGDEGPDDEPDEIDYYICGRVSDKHKDTIRGGVSITAVPEMRILDSTHEFEIKQRSDHHFNFPYESYTHIEKYDISKDHTGTITVVFDKEIKFPYDWTRIGGGYYASNYYTTFDGDIGKFSRSERSDTAREYGKASVDDIPKFEQLRDEYKKLGKQLTKEYREQYPEKFPKTEPKKPNIAPPRTEPLSPPRETWESLADFIVNYTNVTDVRQYFIDENAEKSFIDEFLDEFPEFKKKIDRAIANFILPFAFAQTPSYVWVTGSYDFLDKNGTATDASRVNMCLYDAGSVNLSSDLLGVKNCRI